MILSLLGSSFFPQHVLDGHHGDVQEHAHPARCLGFCGAAEPSMTSMNGLINLTTNMAAVEGLTAYYASPFYILSGWSIAQKETVFFFGHFESHYWRVPAGVCRPVDSLFSCHFRRLDGGGGDLPSQQTMEVEHGPNMPRLFSFPLLTGHAIHFHDCWRVLEDCWVELADQG